MATKKTAKKKAAKKKAAGKKAASAKAGAKRTVTKKTAPKKAVKKKATRGKAVKKKAATPKKSTARKPSAQKAHKPKLGFDPLSREDIEALSVPDVNAVVAGVDEFHPGIDSLIRDTTSDSATGLSRQAMPEPRAEEGRDLKSPAPEKTAVADKIEKPESSEAPGLSKDEKPAQAVTQSPSVKAKAEDESVEVSTFFSFRLGHESFAVTILRVREVLEYLKPTRVPKTQKHMIGVINLRGNVVPVVDLRTLFGMPQGERTVHSAIIILDVGLRDEQVTIGALVDSVREVIDIKDSDIEPPPRIGMGLNTDFIKGMGRYAEEFLIILDVDKVFSIEGLMEKQE